MSSQAAAVAVVGDPIVDWAIVTPPGAALQIPYLWGQRGTVSISSMPGGPALIADLLGELGIEAIGGSDVPAAALSDPRQSAVARSFTAWSSVPASGARAWRLREFLGQIPPDAPNPPQPVPAARVLVVDDSNLGLRTSGADWSAVFPHLDAAEAVLVRTAVPFAEGPLWKHLSGHAGDRLTLILSLGDVRKQDGAIGQALSWEGTANEVLGAVRKRPELAGVARVVVGIGLAGAVVVEGADACVVYDPAHLEADWEAQRAGLPYGMGSALTAGIAAALARGGKAADGVAAGLQFGRQIHERGLELTADENIRLHRDPVAQPAAPGPFACHAIPPEPAWTFIGAHSSGEFRSIAELVLHHGLDVGAQKIPVERIGAWASIDRVEIESIRSVRNIMREYLEQPTQRRPLSIAVFGPPGSGKSFAIKELARHLSARRPMPILEFNLSQFADVSSLVAAFQRLRDCAVEGALPLVFWDEFDSQRQGVEFGWLASFLAPMQDGEFLDGATPRPLGGAIFVFAGGTHVTMESFKARAPAIPQAKATDFLSRLRGFINVLGPNRANESDDSFVVRRALLLRHVLARRAPQIIRDGVLNLDPGLAHAFLATDKYVHGARSMEAIIEMSAIAGRGRYGRSSLPAQQQLALHVDAAEFMELVEAGG